MLWPTAYDERQQLMRYRAQPSVCNACPVKADCTSSPHGREITRPTEPWPHSEAARFHRGIVLVARRPRGAAARRSSTMLRHHQPGDLARHRRCRWWLPPCWVSVHRPLPADAVRIPRGHRPRPGCASPRRAAPPGPRTGRHRAVTAARSSSSLVLVGPGRRRRLLISARVLREYERGVVLPARTPAAHRRARAGAAGAVRGPDDPGRPAHRDADHPAPGGHHPRQRAGPGERRRLLPSRRPGAGHHRGGGLPGRHLADRADHPAVGARPGRAGHRCSPSATSSTTACAGSSTSRPSPGASR